MDAKDIRNLSEAYREVYQLDEELTGDRASGALRKGFSKLVKSKEGSINNRTGRGQSLDLRLPTKRGGSGQKGLPKTSVMGTGEKDRGKGSKASRRAAVLKNEDIDIYDIILSHLLDEGYADNEQAAEVIMVNMSEEQLDEISQKLATKAYAASKTGEFEGADSDRDLKRTDNLERHIKRKFGDKAVKHAERAADAQTFGRKDASGKSKKSPQPRIQKSDYRTTQDGKMHKQDQKELKTELRIKRDRRLRAARAADTNEQVDIYDIILSHLLDEGYAETVEAAEVIMVNMSEDWRESIVEAVSGGSYYDLPGVVIRAASGAASKLLNRGQPPAAKPKPHPSDSKLVDVSTADKAAKNLPGSRVYNQRRQQQSR